MILVLDDRWSATTITTNASVMYNTGNNNSYTHSRGIDLRDQTVNSIDLRDHTGGEAFMEGNYDVSEHDSNNNECIYRDPSHLSSEDGLLTGEDEQALRESFVFIPTVKAIRSKTSDVAPIAMVKTIN